MDSPVETKRETDLVTISVTLPAYAIHVIQNVANSRYIKRSQLIRQIIMERLVDDPAYDTILDTPNTDPNLDTEKGD